MSRSFWAAAITVLVMSLVPGVALAANSTSSRSPRASALHKPKQPRVERVVVLELGSGVSLPGGAAGVRSLQRQLVRMGFSPGPIDGRYGPLTTQAVAGFQRAHGLVADGIVGPETRKALAGGSLVSGAGYLQPGGSPAVRSLQRRLSRAGFSPGPGDGRYGPLTSASGQAVPARASSCRRRDRRRADPARAREPSPEGVSPTAPHGASATAPRRSEAASAHQPDDTQAADDAGGSEAADGSGTARPWVVVVEVGDLRRVDRDRDRDRGLCPGRTRSPTEASGRRGRQSGTGGCGCPVGGRRCSTHSHRCGRGIRSGIQGRRGPDTCTGGGDTRASARAGDTRTGVRGRTTGGR